jgi:hypothetical protein
VSRLIKKVATENISKSDKENHYKKSGSTSVLGSINKSFTKDVKYRKKTNKKMFKPKYKS